MRWITVAKLDSVKFAKQITLKRLQINTIISFKTFYLFMKVFEIDIPQKLS